jgi:hypothetical protein
VAIIVADRLTKVFRVPQKDPGVAGALKALVRPRFREKVAVDAISFTVEPGEVVGYIGVNGAGKSTTIKMLTGILVPTAGQVRVLGRNPHRDRVANAGAIGVVFGQRTQLATFFSGALVPLALMPGWLQAVAAALPFAQGLYAPLALLSGIVPLSAAPQIWAVQAAWLVGLVLVSRLVFALAVRQITVQGG